MTDRLGRLLLFGPPKKEWAVVSFLVLTACTSSPSRSSDPRSADYGPRTDPAVVRSEVCPLGEYWRSDVERCFPIRDSGSPRAQARAKPKSAYGGPAESCPSGAYWDSASGNCKVLTQQEQPQKPAPLPTPPPATSPRWHGLSHPRHPVWRGIGPLCLPRVEDEQ